jgi:hypothetical protein
MLPPDANSTATFLTKIFMAYPNCSLNLISGNNNFRSALYTLEHREEFYKHEFENCIKKRGIEKIFAELKSNFFETIEPESSICLSGPDLKSHKENALFWNCKHIIIPELNPPTYFSMKQDETYLENRSFMSIVNKEFFNKTVEVMRMGQHKLSDIDYDGTMKIFSVQTPIIQFLGQMNKYEKALTDRFSFISTFNMRGVTPNRNYNVFKNIIMTFLDKLEKFKVIEGHYVNYKDNNRMVTIILLMEKVNYWTNFYRKKPFPYLSEYNYFDKNFYNFERLRKKIKQNSYFL